MLDALADYQAQVDYLDMQKRDLLNEVKIPAEVLAAQDEANKRRQAVDNECRNKLDAIQELCDAQMSEVVIPPEIEAAFRAIEAKRNEIANAAIQKRAAVLAEAQAHKNEIEAALTQSTQDVFTQVETRRAEINTEFAGKAEAAQDNIAKLTAEIKDAVIREKKSAKGAHYQAVYVKGRVTWNTDMLDGMIVAFPALAQARKEGQPSVTLRRN
jgi:hypothetical protein